MSVKEGEREVEYVQVPRYKLLAWLEEIMQRLWRLRPFL